MALISAYTENGLVEQPAIQLFSELGWETVNATDTISRNSAESIIRNITRKINEQG